MKEIYPQKWYDTFPKNVKDYSDNQVSLFFEYALKQLHENFMFMYIKEDYLYFKHCETREYIKFPISFNDTFLKYKIN